MKRMDPIDHKATAILRATLAASGITERDGPHRRKRALQAGGEAAARALGTIIPEGMGVWVVAHGSTPATPWAERWTAYICKEEQLSPGGWIFAPRTK